MTPSEQTDEARRLRDRAEWLLSPHRRSGPSRHEADEEARACLSRAETLECDAFYAVPVGAP